VALAAPATATAVRKPARAPRKEGSPGVRELSAQATRESILLAAIDVFAKDGFAGGRVDEISRAANSHDRMIYYYFESKEGLFIAVLEEIYRRMNAAEEQLELGADKPVESLAAIIRFVWRYYQRNPSFVTLLNTENLHGGRHIAKSPRASDYSSRAIELLEGVLAAGAAQGVFRSDVAPRDIYLMILSMGYFPMSNRHTLKSFLGQPMDTPEASAHWEDFVIEAVMRVLAPPST
jgi:AcrR family transcriptional regulator